MTKIFTDNLGLKLVALLLAVGIVWIKALEKINYRNIREGVQVTVENRPDNLLLPDPWIPPTVLLTVQGPSNIVEFIRPDQSSFRIDLSKVEFPEDGSPVTVTLSDANFRANLDPSDRAKVSVVDESIRPRQIVIRILPWDVQKPRPAVESLASSPNQKMIPLYRVEKRVPVEVPRYERPPEDLLLAGITVDPSQVLVTGKLEAVEQIKSVSTSILDLSSIYAEIPPMYLPFQGLGRNFDVWSFRENIRGGTVFLKVQKKDKKGDAKTIR